MPGSGLAVSSAGGTRLDRAPSVLRDGDPPTLRVDLPTLPPGEYVVTWRVTGQADGEFNQGSFGFTVLPDLGPPTVDRATLARLATLLVALGGLSLLGGAGERDNRAEHGSR